MFCLLVLIELAQVKEIFCHSMAVQYMCNPNADYFHLAVAYYTVVLKNIDATHLYSSYVLIPVLGPKP